MIMKKTDVNAFLVMYDDMDIDVIDDYADDFCIAYCTGYVLTLEGCKEFNEVLNLPVTIYSVGGSTWAEVHVENEHQHKEVTRLFWSIAGYCSDSIFNKWFKWEG